MEKERNLEIIYVNIYGGIMIYITADTHFCHGNIIGSCGRHFENVGEMNRALIENWNSYVTVRDEVYILGDFMYKGKGKDANNILSKLNGRKYLVKGNHEKYLTDPEFKQDAFEWIKDYHVLKYEGVKIVIFHYPMLSWDGSHRGSIHLYGHVHNNGERDPEFGEKLRLLGPRAFNVGVDVNGFYPVSIRTVIDKVKIEEGSPI
jgi:calcineurin-like phosphoesterase family protein